MLESGQQKYIVKTQVTQDLHSCGTMATRETTIPWKPQASNNSDTTVTTEASINFERPHEPSAPPNTSVLFCVPPLQRPKNGGTSRYTETIAFGDCNNGRLAKAATKHIATCAAIGMIKSKRIRCSLRTEIQIGTKSNVLFTGRHTRHVAAAVAVIVVG